MVGVAVGVLILLVVVIACLLLKQRLVPAKKRRGRHKRHEKSAFSAPKSPVVQAASRAFKGPVRLSDGHPDESDF